MKVREIKNISYKKWQQVLFYVVSILMAALLVYLWDTPNIEVKQSREMVGYRKIENVSSKKIEDKNAPAGIVREFRFRLEEVMEYDTTLVFQFSHQNVEVYLDQEKVYSLQRGKGLYILKTPGENCVMIPLYREDVGKEVRVLLTPVYKNYQDQKITFFEGSKLAIYKEKMRQSFPELFLSLIDILVGMILLYCGVYLSMKKVNTERMYALAMVAISLGLWNFTQTEFSPFLFAEKTVFLYYVSLVMLMVAVVPLIKSMKLSKRDTVLEYWCIFCGVINMIQLLLQLLGIYDLREMLKVTHVMIVISSAVLIISGMSEWKDCIEQRRKGKKKTSLVWILGVGALIDMFIYYVKDSANGLLFVLISILFYVLLEGIRIFSSYLEQRQMLEEKEVQLTLSRITTMVSQIRSHFVFNILNAISGMCKYDPEKADETVVRFARYLRNNIDIMEDDKPINFSTELAHLEDYVLLEQIRFGDKITFYADVKEDQFLIPPLILQPVVENAIKHGITKKQAGGTVILRTWEEGEQIKISVEDDGVGFEMEALEKEKSVGLKNIRYRLHHLMRGTLEIKSEVGAGTTVTITIPKKEEESCMSYM